MRDGKYTPVQLNRCPPKDHLPLEGSDVGVGEPPARPSKLTRHGALNLTAAGIFAPFRVLERRFDDGKIA